MLERPQVAERIVGWLSRRGGLSREPAGCLDVPTGRLDWVVRLMAANAVDNPA